MKKFFLLAGLVFLSTIVYSQKLSRIQYIQQYKDIEVRQMRMYNIPASIILAQGCLESGNGNSSLAVKANNHFGIKCHTSWKGKTYRHDDDKRRECFRKYNSAVESYEDHSIFLSTGKRYASLFDLKITDYKAWAHGLKAAGYATNPKYAQLLIDIIETYKLYEFDVPKTFNTSRKELKAKKRYEKMQKKALKKKGVVPPPPVVVGDDQPLQECRLYKYSKKRKIYLQDGKYYVYALKGDTYKSLAKEYKQFTKTVLKSNNLKSADRIAEGAKVFICNKFE
ncbi:MAG: glucosaminidase domain-containing protein [Bacteroidales bacterium]|nr:glucosaminidase domain-containing protein [Bacteroidales bacterium]